MYNRPIYFNLRLINFCIVKNITQIFISREENDISPKLLNNSQRLINLYPEYNYKLFSDDSIITFLSENFNSEILKTYKSLIPFSYKSDFARYCLLYKLGGWYFDIGLEVNKKIIINDNINLVFFRDLNLYTKTSWACAGGIIYAKQGNKIIKKAIQLVVENTKNNYYGLTPLCPTGPSLFGKAIAIEGIDKNVIIGDFIELTPNHRNKNKAMVLSDGTIVAFNKEAKGGDLKALGCNGTNNYNDYWNERKIYDKFQL